MRYLSYPLKEKLSMFHQRLAPFALALGCALWVAGPATVFAESLTSSAASSASSATSMASASVSDSIEGSSKSSGGGQTNKVAAGTYRIAELKQTESGRYRVALEPQAGSSSEAQPFTLWLPATAVQAAAKKAPLAVGQALQVTEESYGYRFALPGAAAQTAQPFFLALHDHAQRELRTSVISL
jgi:hypothetical protein